MTLLADIWALRLRFELFILRLRFELLRHTFVLWQIVFSRGHDILDFAVSVGHIFDFRGFPLLPTHPRLSRSVNGLVPMCFGSRVRTWASKLRLKLRGCYFSLESKIWALLLRRNQLYWKVVVSYLSSVCFSSHRYLCQSVSLTLSSLCHSLFVC